MRLKREQCNLSNYMQRRFSRLQYMKVRFFSDLLGRRPNMSQTCARWWLMMYPQTYYFAHLQKLSGVYGSLSQRKILFVDVPVVISVTMYFPSPISIFGNYNTPVLQLDTSLIRLMLSLSLSIDRRFSNIVTNRFVFPLWRRKKKGSNAQIPTFIIGASFSMII